VTASEGQSAEAARAWALALGHFQAGRADEAERLCREVLRSSPAHADALHVLGIIAHRRGDHLLAAERIEEAVRIDPAKPHYLNTLAVVYQALGRAGEAEGCLRGALSLDPGFAPSHNNLGIALRSLGLLRDAESSFRTAVGLQPDFAEAYNNLGNVLREMGCLEQAESSLLDAVGIRPDFAEAHAGLGMVLRAMGRHAQAESSARRAIALKPDYAEAHNDLGVALIGLGRLLEAEGSLRQALALDPSLAVAQGNLVYLLNCIHGRTPAEIYAEHREFARRFCPPADARPHPSSRDPERRLRVGYVSADLRHHSLAFFIEPVLASHDRTHFEIFCYSNSAHSDAVTERLRSSADEWREVHALDDETLAGLVREDGIDILVDLSGFSANNRLTAFARKPAPVQATWLGYLNTTGLDAMDYRITDERASPAGLLDAFHSERLIRLPDSQWCFQPAADSPEVAPPPCVKSGSITFAAFSNPAKIGPEVIELWSRLLARVAGSRLLLIANGLASVPDQYEARFVHHGIARERFRVLGSKPFREYLDLHGEADVMLDTFPYTGGTTTCHALWMGVPVVTLVGDTATSRGGASLLHAVGLAELVAQSPAQYVDMAAGLASDPARLAALRAGLRERMLGSALMDAQRFTRNLESAYRAMWRSWCAGQREESGFRRVLHGLRKRFSAA
jgi:predicted O-linked N-acetylglucosamine transferase (SPINDLY family)